MRKRSPCGCRLRRAVRALVFPLMLLAVAWSGTVGAEESGAAIAKSGAPNGVAACASCHGVKGEGNAAAGFPRLAGLSQSYLQAQLAAFASGQRQNAVMQPMAKALTPSQTKAVAAYFSTLPFPAPAAEQMTEAASPADAGAWLATRGKWESDVPACAACHGAGGAGVGTSFPALHGQSAAYIAAQLHAFKEGKRPAGPLKLMGTVASKLTDADITAVSDYYGRSSSEKRSVAGVGTPAKESAK